MSARGQAILSSVSELADEHIDLGRCALAIALIEYPSLEIDRVLHHLDVMANQVGAPSRDGAMERLERLRHLLFETMKFAGNTKAYDDPRNSFLNEVLNRRLGIPISLSVVTMEVGKRIGLDIHGVGLPGHFIVGMNLDSSSVYFDPFSQGRLLTERDCRQLVKGMFAGELPFRQKYLEPQRKKDILTRMLRNLKHIYIRKNDCERALATIDLILCVNPRSPDEIRDRGLVYYQMECFKAALEDLRTYLAGSPKQATDEVRSLVSAIERKVSLLH